MSIAAQGLYRRPEIKIWKAVIGPPGEKEQFAQLFKMQNKWGNYKCQKSLLAAMENQKYNFKN